MDTRHPAIAKRERSVLVLVDVQERIGAVMDRREELEHELRRLLAGARELEVPVLVTEQYRKGLGPTLPSLLEAAGPVEPIEKMSFSCFGEPRFVEALQGLEREDLVVCGIEAHVCVQQTVLDGLARGYRVQVVQDAVTSRAASNREAALRRMEAQGADLTTVETVLFEWLERCDHARFKAISRLVR